MKVMWFTLALLILIAIVYQLAPDLGQALAFYLFVGFVIWLVVALARNKG